MACQVIIRSWTFTRLVGAFLDLAIAYFLLCCSAIAFFVSRFLDILGLSLPCPCDGLFGYCGPCAQRILVDCPAESVSSIQLSVKSKFPFDTILARNDHCRINLKLLREGNSHGGVLELEGEASYSSFSDPRRSQHSFSGSDSFGKFDIKGKGASTQRSRCGIRRRRRASADYGKFTSASSYDHPLRSESRRSPSASSKMENVENSTPLRICGSAVPDVECNDEVDENKFMHGTAWENLKNSVGHEHGGVEGEDENIVRLLELALEEEQATRATLCSELEQERLAAATAADEAMAMISRLQEEKASIEIEAHQYQRILEEKSVYDAEEMDILKEIIVRRERERLILEKEVEAYRKVFQENGLESQSNDKQGQIEDSFLDPSVDPMLVLQQLSDSINKRGNIESTSNFPDFSSGYAQKQTTTASEGKESSSLPMDHETKIIHELETPQCTKTIPDHLPCDDEANQDIQEKGILSMGDILYPQFSDSSCSQGKETMYGVVNSNDGKQIPPQVGEPHVHDVHIIDSKGIICKNANGEDRDSLLMHNNDSNAVRKCEWPLWESESQKVDGSGNNGLKFGSDINRSSSDTVGQQFRTASSSPDRSFASELRRNSVSSVDHERLKIDNEIGWLKARLTAVQEQKEKLKSSLEQQERGKSELQLLEDINNQLREIRHLTAPEKAAARQGSLPPLSSKVTSKKRRSRNVYAGFGQSESS